MAMPISWAAMRSCHVADDKGDEARYAGMADAFAAQ
jgi:hypothetical protein